MKILTMVVRMPDNVCDDAERYWKFEMDMGVGVGASEVLKKVWTCRALKDEVWTSKELSDVLYDHRYFAAEMAAEAEGRLDLRPDTQPELVSCTCVRDKP